MNSKDCIFIEALQTQTVIGVFDWEKTIRQKLIFDIRVGYDIARSAGTDDVVDTVSYADICDCVLDFVEGNTFGLVEKVAEEVAQLILAQFNVAWVHLKVAKPEAVKKASSVGVEIYRDRQK